MTSQNPATPNVVMFMIDDLDVDTMQRLLDADLLPNIRNRIVNGATEFTNAYVPSSLCSASRASMLTGKYAHNHEVWHVIGTEGPQVFDDYLANSGDAYLPTWLGAGYYRAFVGKSHLGAQNPNWDFFRRVEGYDPRPGMYTAFEGGAQIMPPVYQPKYIGDQAKQAISRSGTRPLMLLVSPFAVHVNVAAWRKMDSYAEAPFVGEAVAFCQFRDETAGIWRQHLVTLDWGTGSPIHMWWSRDSKSRDSNWGEWTFNGDEATVAPNTGAGYIVGWNVFSPAPNIRRQQFLRVVGPNVRFYTRDVVNGIAQPWAASGDESVLAGTGTLPVVGWSAVRFPGGVIRQQVVRGNETSGYQGFARQRTATGGFGPWRIDPDWGEQVAFGTVRGINLIPTTGARYIVQLLQRRPGATAFEWWQSPELVDYQELASSGNNPAVLGQAEKLQFPDEGKLFGARSMKWADRLYDLRNTYPDDPGRVDPINPARQVHPYFMMRAYAEGSWSPVAPGQTYDWGNDYPAGRLRRGREPHAFDVVDNRLELPMFKASYNRPMDSGLPFFSSRTWPDLTGEVPGGLRQQDYLRRLWLDRLEQMLSIDRMVGDVLAAAGPNTIVIFAADNGHFNGEHRLSNKLTAHEEATRIPLFIKKPGGTARKISRLVSMIDIAPTLLDYAGLNWEDPIYNIDGRSLRPFIDTGNVPTWRNSLLIEYRRPRGSNFPATDWRYGMPDYLGLRVADEATSSNARSLYIQYYFELDDLKSGFSFEHYFMLADPHQVNNTITAQNNRLARILREHLAASGAACREQDAAPIP